MENIKLEIYQNLRQGSRHYVRLGTNQTLCGLSLKRGHAWDIARTQQVTCINCLRIYERHYSGCY